jgi:hypothetical protein
MAPLTRALLTAYACAAVVAGCAVQVLETGDYAETFAPAGAGRVVLSGLDGDVLLQGAEVAAVEIRGTRYSVAATRSAAREGLRHAALDAAVGGDDLLLSFAPPFELEGLVDLVLNRVSTLPREIGVAVSVESGDLTVSGLVGDLDLLSVDGDIAIDDAGSAFVRAEVGGGEIRYAVGLTGFTIECQAGGGAVEVDEALLAAGAVRHEPEADGTIVVTYGDTYAKRVELTAAGGRIAIELSPDDDSPTAGRGQLF